MRKLYIEYLITSTHDQIVRQYKFMIHENYATNTVRDLTL